MASKVAYELWGTIVDPSTGQETRYMVDWDKTADTMNAEMNSIIAAGNVLPDGRTVTNLVVSEVVLN
jgi:hypothetical protein